MQRKRHAENNRIKTKEGRGQTRLVQHAGKASTETIPRQKNLWKGSRNDAIEGKKVVLLNRGKEIKRGKHPTVP